MAFDTEYFDAGLYRVGTRSEKWDAMRAQHGAGVIPLWVADMDFPSPPAVQRALLTRAAHATYGYTEEGADDAQAMLDFWRRRHGLVASREETTMLPCVVTGLKLAILALTQPGDGVIIQSPVYGPFRQSVEATGRKVLDAPLRRDADGRWQMDLAAVEDRLRQGAKLMLLCSPHNPVSRLWRREELEKLIALLGRYRAYLAADEIHADFVFAPEKFVPVLSLTGDNALSLCAASKTFNLAGLQQAYCLCRDAKMREKVRAEIDRAGVRCGNLFALEGTRAAFAEGDEWLDGLLRYLDGNRAALTRFVHERLPGAVLAPIEATYLGWLDLRAWGYPMAELTRRTLASGVCFTEGTFFAPEAGDGFLRVNFACPRRQLLEGLERLRTALA